MDWTIIGLWVLFVMYPVNVIASIYMIGKPRKPSKPSDAIAVLIISVIYMALIYSAIVRL